MRRFLTGPRIFTGAETLSGLGILIEDGVILDLCASASGTGEITRLAETALLVPGFIDVQVNGGGSVQFNELPTPDALKAIAAVHRRAGTTGFLPTFITDDRVKMAAAIEVAATLAAEPDSGVLGLHLEGPFLNPERRGVHRAEFIRPPDPGEVDALAALASRFPCGKVLMSLAPEVVDDAVIRQLAGAGIIVAAAHSMASIERMRAAIAAGLTGFTHLFNAMPPVVNRDPRIAAAGMTDAETWCGIIADGIHVHPALLRLTLTAKPRGKVFLVTDAMPPLGTTAESFELYGQTILRHEGRLTTEDGTLAGADLDLPAAIRNCLSLLGLELEEALRMASLYPAEFLGLADRRGRIAPGYAADLALLSPQIEVLGTWVDGIWESASR
jgi:N-acetylglucosamine-6-phosphate deacetylase